jgi:hypothetical protein
MAHLALSLKQVANFKPLPGEMATITFPSGSEYYGDVDQQGRPHGHGVLLNKKEGSRYGGHWFEGKQHGSGVLLTKAFDYDGEFANDGMYGAGTITYKEGDIALRDDRTGFSFFSPFEGMTSSAAPKPLEYRGDFHPQFHRHGRGRMIYKNDDTYDGEWVRNKREGRGKFSSADGDRYDGEWLDDQRHGTGKLKLSTGMLYEGAFLKGKRHGEGKLTFPNGDIYAGEFQDDDIRGFGVMRYRNGDVYEGAWKNGVRQGEGRFHLAKRKTVIAGQFSDGLLHGQGSVDYQQRGDFFAGHFNRGERKYGTMWFQDGAVYSGDWRGENMHGRGLMWFADGGFFSGKWSASLRHGFGEMTYSDGCEYVGDFVQDRRHGHGMLSLPDGRIAVGQWSGGDRLVQGYIGEWDGRSTLCGVGRFLYDDGSIYEGMVKAGKRDGFGVLSLRAKLEEKSAPSVVFTGAATLANVATVAASSSAPGTASGAGGPAPLASADTAKTKRKAEIGEIVCPHHDQYQALKAASAAAAAATGPNDGNVAAAAGPAEEIDSTTGSPQPDAGAATPAASSARPSGRQSPDQHRLLLADPPLAPPLASIAPQSAVVPPRPERPETPQPSPARPNRILRGSAAVEEPLGLPHPHNPCHFPRRTTLQAGDRGMLVSTPTLAALESKFSDERGDAASRGDSDVAPTMDLASRTADPPPGYHIVLQYKGLWSEDIPAGEGTLYFVSEGSTYQGQFAFGQRCGKGVLVSAVGQLYSGEWEGDRPNGTGCFFEVNKDQPIVAQELPTPTDEKDNAAAHSNSTDEDDDGFIGVEHPAATASTSATDDSTSAMSGSHHGAVKGLTNAAYGAISWIGRAASKLVPGRRRRSRQRPDASTEEEEAPVILGYAPIAAVEGGWHAGRLTQGSNFFFADGTIVQAQYLAGRAIVDFPHRSGTITTNTNTTSKSTTRSTTAAHVDPTTAIACHFCKQPFTWLRPAQPCKLCSRVACGSCLSDMSLQPHVPVHTDASEGAAGRATPGPDTAASHRPHVNVDRASSVKACKDCFNAVHQHLSFMTVWQPSERRPPRTSIDQPGSTSTPKEQVTNEYFVYRGYVAGDVPHYYGSLWYSNEACYTGEFRLGSRHGSGVLTFANGEEYRGSWADDERHGHGSCRLCDGTFVIGNWRSDDLLTLEYHGFCDASLRRSGLGYGYEPETGIKYNGQWSAGEQSGTGTVEWPDGSIYRGHMLANKPHGRGKWMGTSSSYVGEFEEGQPHGRGERREDVYALSGSFKFGQPHGVIVRRNFQTKDVLRTIYVNGTPYSHAFVQGQRQTDLSARECNGCNTAFGLFFRRHHCRCCGLVFCDRCSPRRAALPYHFRDIGQAPDPNGMSPLSDPLAVYRVCVPCSDKLSLGCAVGSVYFGTPRGLEYHGQLSTATHTPKGRGYFRLPRSGATVVAEDAEVALPAAVDRAAEELSAVHRGSWASRSQERLNEEDQRALEDIHTWWRDVAARSGVVESGAGTSSPVATLDAVDFGLDARFPILEGRTEADFMPASQDLGFDVAVFVDPRHKQADPPSQDKRLETENCAQEEGDAASAPPPLAAQDKDGSFAPVAFPPLPTPPSSDLLERPAIPVDPTHEEIAECVAAARLVSGSRLGVPPSSVLRLLKHCADAPSKPKLKEPFDTATWSFRSSAAMPVVRVTTSGEKANVDVRGRLATGKPLVAPALPPVAGTDLPRLEVGFNVTVGRDRASGDQVARTERVYHHSLSPAATGATTNARPPTGSAMQEPTNDVLPATDRPEGELGTVVG